MRNFIFGFLIFCSFHVHGQKDYSVIFFLLDDCPVCIEYTSTIDTIFSSHHNEFDFTAYFPNKSSTKEKINDFKTEYQISIDCKTDYDKSVSTNFNITHTPEVIVLDNKNQKVVYQGAIDDRFVKRGRRRGVIHNEYLSSVLIKLKKGLNVTPFKTIPIGCLVNY